MTPITQLHRHPTGICNAGPAGQLMRAVCRCGWKDTTRPRVFASCWNACRRDAREHVEHCAGGQRLRDDWRGNPAWAHPDQELDDLEGFERQQLRGEL